MRIVFMGTPDFAVASLQALHNAGHEIVMVVTVPDKPSGRGLNVLASDVKKYAIDQKLNLLQPPRLKDPEFISALRDTKADLIVVVAFRMLPADVWKLIPTINLHGSLLPLYRGAAPINWAIINGEVETGLTTFYINEQIDQGDVLEQTKLSIDTQETFGELYDRMKIKGSELLLSTVSGIEKGKIKGTQQSSEGIDIKKLVAPKLTRENCRIDWTRKAEEIYNQIRGLSPYPAAWSMLIEEGRSQMQLKVFEANVCDQSDINEPGQIISDGRSYLRVVCGEKALELTSIQLQGKKKLRTDEFLRGYKGIFTSSMK